MKREPISYPPGFFTELVRLFDWPPGWSPQPIVGKRSQIETNEGAARGDTGTINRLSRNGANWRSDLSKGVVR